MPPLKRWKFIFLFWAWSKCGGSPLKKRDRGSDSLSLLRLACTNTAASTYGSLTFYQITYLGEAKCHVTMGGHWRGTSQGTAVPDKRPEKHWGVKTTMGVRWEGRPPPLNLRMRQEPWLTAVLQPRETPRARGTQLRCPLVSDPWNWSDKPLLLGLTGNLLHSIR